MFVMTVRGALSVNITGDLNIAASRQCRQQIELLEHEPDSVPPNSSKFVVTHAGNFLAINEYLTCSRFRHRAQITFTNSKVHSAKRLDFNFADPVGFTKIGCFEQSFHLLDPKLIISITNTTRT